jgi:hypothetical protein
VTKFLGNLTETFFAIPTNNGVHVGYEVLTAVVMEIAIFWDTAQCSPYMNRRF